MTHFFAVQGLATLKTLQTIIEVDTIFARVPSTANHCLQVSPGIWSLFVLKQKVGRWVF